MSTVPVLSSKLFSYDYFSRTMTTDMSMLEHALNGEAVLRRISDATADHGFTIRSEKTGKEATFFVSNVDLAPASDEIAEIQGWHLRPTLETRVNMPLT